jgi:hypothetical protein
MANLCQLCWNAGRHLWEGRCICTGHVTRFVAPYFGDNPLINWTAPKKEPKQPTAKRGKK